MNKEQKIYCIIGRVVTLLAGYSAVAGFYLWIFFKALFG